MDEGLEILDEAECRRLLETMAVGRVAVTIGALPAIFPVNYAVVDGAIVFRTSEGTKLRAALDHAVIAFEVDRTDPIYHLGWSVQVVGMADVMEGSDIGPDRLRVTPWAPGERAHIVRIEPEIITGRRIIRANP